jgi:hypothetical protein
VYFPLKLSGCIGAIGAAGGFEPPTFGTPVLYSTTAPYSLMICEQNLHNILIFFSKFPEYIYCTCTYTV